MIKLLEVFVGVSMTKQHDGLAALAKKYKVDLAKLPEGTGAVFISRDRCRMKVYCWNGVLSYIRAASKSRPFSLDALSEFPKAFDANGAFSYEKALMLSLEKMFQKKMPLDEKRV
jgi:hypothetical protein